MSAASCSGDLRRGKKASATAPASSAPCRKRWTRWRSGSPRAWYWPQSQSDQGASRPIWKPTVRVQKTCASWNGSGSRSRTEKAASVATAKPSAKRQLGLRPGYVSQSGTTSRDANFVQPESAARTPRAAGLETSQKPQTRKQGMSASFVFEFETYWVNGIRRPGEREHGAEPLAAEAQPDEEEAEQREEVERDRGEVRGRQVVPLPAPPHGRGSRGCTTRTRPARTCLPRDSRSRSVRSSGPTHGSRPTRPPCRRTSSCARSGSSPTARFP